VKLTGTYRKLIKDTTINDVTLLSTDYLNHFNELIMLLEMVGDMPDMLEEAEVWAPKTYQEHFRDSSFQHKELAVWAYEQAPDEYRVPMDDCTASMDTDILANMPLFRKSLEEGRPEELALSVSELTARLRDSVDTMSAIINGALDQAGYEAQRLADENAEDKPDKKEKIMDQSDIDALFD